MSIVDRRTNVKLKSDESLIDSDVDIEEELERDREDTSLSEVDEDADNEESINKTEQPRVVTEDRFSQIKNYKKSTRVLTAAEQTLQSQILLLCSALGGTDPTSENKREYILGVDALACLKDLKRWIKAVDDATHMWHVAAACHENELVENDLIPIMIQIPKRANNSDSNYMQNILLSALELLVALTRPLVLDVEVASPAQIDLYIKLKKAHVKCKDKILNFDNGRCLKSVVGVALPILAFPKEKRTNRDSTILNLCLNFFRNVIRIGPADFTVSKKKSSSKTQQVIDNMPPGITRDDISYDNLIYKFKKNRVLMFVQTITAGLGTEFDSEVLFSACLDIYFYITYGIEPELLFIASAEPKNPTTSSPAEVTTHLTPQSETGARLADLMAQEKEIKKQLFSNNITRHANFGTLLSIKEGSDDAALTVGTQRSFLRSDPIEELDSGVSKKVASTRYANRSKESTKSDFDTSFEAPAKKFTNSRTSSILKEFCSDFTEAGFSVLGTEIRRQVTSNGVSLNAFTEFHYFQVMAWILKFERILRDDSNDGLSFKRFGYIMMCLEEQMIRMLLVGSLPQYLQNREFNLLRAATNCFKEILLTTIDIHRLDQKDNTNLNDEDKEELEGYITVSEAVLRNIFANEEVIDVLFRIPQDARKVSLNYAVDMTDFTYVLFKTLHYLSKLKVPIVLAKKIRQTSKRYYGENHDASVIGSEDESDAEFDVADPQKLKRFQVLDKEIYSRFEERLFNERIVDTYIWVFSRFGELNEKQVRRCMSYFNRLLLKWKDHFLKLTRLDFMLILHDLKNARFSVHTMNDLSKMLSYFMRILERLYKHSKTILLETLTDHQEHEIDVKLYLLGGDLTTVREKRFQSRAEDLKFSEGAMSHSYKISVLVSLLCYADKIDLVQELIQKLTDYRDQKVSWEAKTVMEDGITGLPSSPVSFKERLELPDKMMREEKRDARFRLLLHTIGFAGNVLINRTASDELNQTISLIDVALKNPMESFELEGKVIPEYAEPDEPPHESDVIIQKSGPNEKGLEPLEDTEREARDETDKAAVKHNIYGTDIIDYSGSEGSVDDLGDGNGYVEDNIDLMEARLDANEKRIKGRALKKKNMRSRKRRHKHIDPEDDDPLPFSKKTGGSKKRKKNASIPMHEGVEKVQKEKISEPKKHLSSKFIDSDEDESDGEKKTAFFEREKRLLKLVHDNENKPLTPEQYNALFNLDLAKDTSSESEGDDLNFSEEKEMENDGDKEEVEKEEIISNELHQHRAVIRDSEDEE
ncbi:hypothetical protein FOA43_000347 [Brettanomyces nanus]|uniref:Topoisomerase 1-associated factor 1 n=1 Tax=Eeniella nana TaxID=13502 RepID=A0A875RX02_EENNA|nr:uncharacterized protein FOA43_000347 [Brettanomyces nanus]QPG73043.1 hypothetical protein FOA43_000347 [Brettanomyces nanus]